MTGCLSEWLRQGHRMRWVHTSDDMTPGDLCFFLGYEQLVRPEPLKMHRHNLVVHASDLPQGKGWWPMTWQVLEGARRLPVTLLEATESVDAGDIYLQEWLDLVGDELLDELREQVANATCSLCRTFVDEHPGILEQARPQSGESSFYSRRGPKDSVLDPNRSLVE